MESVSSVEEQLYACLFPGRGRYSPQHAAVLAGRLREVADSLGQARQQQVKPYEEPDGKRRRKELRGRGRDLDFSAYQQRYVALELLYLGHAYGGFARQEHTEQTIEGHLFAALRTTRLVPAEASWQELRYSRGGRTDKGVSALGQVVALLLRSAARTGEVQPEADVELDYPSLLNRVLPQDIRVLGWADVPDDFSARFSAQYREYKYLIAYRPPTPPGGMLQAASEDDPGSAAAATAAAGAGQGAAAAAAAAGKQGAAEAAPGGGKPAVGHGSAAPLTGAPLGEALDVGRMQEAAAFFLGEHDFRNFCKVDVAQVTNFRRRVLDCRVEELPACAWGGRRLLQLHIRGTAFLWHQVRCMAAVLLMVGRGEEPPGIVATLLDPQQVPRKPQYTLASEEPLLLYSCAYGGLRFQRSRQNQDIVRGQLEGVLTSHLIRAGMLHTIQQRLASDHLQHDGTNGGGKRQRGGAGAATACSKHVPLLQRAKEPAVEERLLKLAAVRGPAAAAEQTGVPET